MMHEELHELVAAWLGDEIPEGQLDELLERLRANAALRVAFAAEVRMFGMLRAVQSAEPRWLGIRSALAIDAVPSASDQAFDRRVEAAIRADMQRRPGGPVRAAWWLLVGGLCVAAVLFGGLLTWQDRSIEEGPLLSDTAEPGSPVAPTSETGSGEILGSVVRVDHVEWEDGWATLEPGAALTAGRLRFRSGTVTIALLSGVQVSIGGPADVRLARLDRISCTRGNVRVEVPKGAEGFVIETPGTAVVDLGTELGVWVEPDHPTQLVVYQGRAEALLVSPEGRPSQSRVLEARQSVELDPQAGTIRNVAPRDMLRRQQLEIPPLTLPPGYADRVAASSPRNYWRATVAAGDEVPDAAGTRRRLRKVGPVTTQPDGSWRFAAGDEPRYLATVSDWDVPAEFALEFWFASAGFHSSVLAVLQHGPVTLSTMAMAELTCRDVSNPLAPGRVRALYRWPPGNTGGVNSYSDRIYTAFRWHHFVVQRRDGRLEQHLDGRLVGATPLDAGVPTGPCQIRFGRLGIRPADPHARSLVGGLAEIAIYGRSLEAEEIRSHCRSDETAGGIGEERP